MHLSSLGTYYCFRNRITFCETLLCPETDRMQLCHLCPVCAQTKERVFADLMQISAEDLRRGTAKSDSNFYAIGSNALCVVWAHTAHK